MADTDTKAKESAKKPDRPLVRDGVSSAVWLNGKPAHNRHVKLRRDVYTRANAQAEADETTLAEVTRAALSQYAEQAPAAARVASPIEGPLLPAPAREAIATLWHRGDEQRINAYLLALSQAGWTLRLIGRSMVAGGLVKSMSRQAVKQRIDRAPQEIPADLPPVPKSGPMRLRLPKDFVDFSFRIADKDYDEALSRATFEGAQITVVVEDFLERYADRRLDLTLEDGRAVGHDPQEVPADTPEHLSHLPAAALREAKRAAKGDWSRITLAGDDLRVV